MRKLFCGGATKPRAASGIITLSINTFAAAARDAPRFASIPLLPPHIHSFWCASDLLLYSINLLLYSIMAMPKGRRPRDEKKHANQVYEPGVQGR